MAWRESTNIPDRLTGGPDAGQTSPAMTHANGPDDGLWDDEYDNLD